MDNRELKRVANEVRKGIIEGTHAAKSGHPGGSLSAADIFTFLYMEELRVDPKKPADPDRDRFVLSKGHTAPGYYAAMAQKGYFPVEELKAENTPAYRLEAAGTSVDALSSGYRYEQRLAGPGNLRGLRDGAGRKSSEQGFPRLHASG